MMPFGDPFGFDRSLGPSHWHRRSTVSPWSMGGGYLDQFFNDSMRQMMDMERGLGEVNLTASGDWHWRCNVSGYKYVDILNLFILVAKRNKFSEIFFTRIYEEDAIHSLTKFGFQAG